MEFSLDRFYQLNRKAIIWIVLFAFIYFMRQFFTLIFLTFILGFFAMPASRFLMRRLKLSRTFSITLVYLSIFLGYIAIYIAIIPSLIGQVGSMQAKLPSLQSNLYSMRDQVVTKYPQVAKVVGLSSEPSLLREGDVLDWWGFYNRLADPAYDPSRRVMMHLPEEQRRQIERIVDETKDPRKYDGDAELEKALLASLNQRVINARDFYQPNFFRKLPARPGSKLEELLAQNRRTMSEREMQRLNRLLIEEAFVGSISSVGQVAEDELQKQIAKYQHQLQAALPDFASYTLTFFVNSLLAILFSFMISYDYARLSKEVESLASSKLRDFFEEAGQPVVRFAATVGQGFQAFVTIALIRVLALLPILALMRVPSLALLALVIFVTGLIPVIGVPLEAAGIALVTLNERGLETTIWAMAALGIVHLLINMVIMPIVFGRQFRINLVLVLLIIFIGHKVGGVWGMILGVPIANYILRDVLQVPFVEEVTGYQTPMQRIASISRKYPVLVGGPRGEELQPPAAPQQDPPAEPETPPQEEAPKDMSAV